MSEEITNETVTSDEKKKPSIKQLLAFVLPVPIAAILVLVTLFALNAIVRSQIDDADRLVYSLNYANISKKEVVGALDSVDSLQGWSVPLSVESLTQKDITTVYDAVTELSSSVNSEKVAKFLYAYNHAPEEVSFVGIKALKYNSKEIREKSEKLTTMDLGEISNGGGETLSLDFFAKFTENELKSLVGAFYQSLHYLDEFSASERKGMFTCALGLLNGKSAEIASAPDLQYFSGQVAGVIFRDFDTLELVYEKIFPEQSEYFADIKLLKPLFGAYYEYTPKLYINVLEIGRILGAYALGGLPQMTEAIFERLTTTATYAADPDAFLAAKDAFYRIFEYAV
ncbi:MAG: hypothetical protein LBN25_02800 [Christensenellaceae bacterium]|jgi:hypothetical protein|nr:hypothetical protein [Christensenellaceae bacterium]